MLDFILTFNGLHEEETSIYERLLYRLVISKQEKD